MALKRPAAGLGAKRVLSDFTAREISLVDRGAVRRAYAVIKAEAVQPAAAAPAETPPVDPPVAAPTLLTEDRVHEIVAAEVAKAIGGVTSILTTLSGQVADLTKAAPPAPPTPVVAAPAASAATDGEIAKSLNLLAERLAKIEEQGRGSGQVPPPVVVEKTLDADSFAASLLMSMRGSSPAGFTAAG